MIRDSEQTTKPRRPRVGQHEGKVRDIAHEQSPTNKGRTNLSWSNFSMSSYIASLFGDPSVEEINIMKNEECEKH